VIWKSDNLLMRGNDLNKCTNVRTHAYYFYCVHIGWHVFISFRTLNSKIIIKSTVQYSQWFLSTSYWIKIPYVQFACFVHAACFACDNLSFFKIGILRERHNFWNFSSSNCLTTHSYFSNRPGTDKESARCHNHVENVLLLHK